MSEENINFNRITTSLCEIAAALGVPKKWD